MRAARRRRHLCNRYRLASLALKPPFQFLHRAGGGHDGKLAFFHFDKLDAISGVNPKRSADLHGNSDLPFGSYGRAGQVGNPFWYIVSLHYSKEQRSQIRKGTSLLRVLSLRLPN
jgi:hypothetical protein